MVNESSVDLNRIKQSYKLKAYFKNQLSVIQIKHLINVQHVLKDEHAKTILMSEME